MVSRQAPARLPQPTQPRRLCCVMTVFGLETGVTLVLQLVMLAVKLFAFINSLLWPAQAYQAADKLTKPAWTIILGLGVAVQVVMGSFSNLLGLVFIVAALV